MITVTYDKNMLRKVQAKLGPMYKEAPKVLKKAINDTAKQARKDLAVQAQKTYVVKTGRFNKAMKIKNATPSKLEATVFATGKVMGLKDFKVSPATMRSGNRRPDIVKAKVLKAGGMKPLEKGGIKAFVTKFQSGHVAVVQRKKDDAYPIKALSSNSIPKMIGNEVRVYGIVRPKINYNLSQNVEKQVNKVLGAL